MMFKKIELKDRAPEQQSAATRRRLIIN